MHTTHGPKRRYAPRGARRRSYYRQRSARARWRETRKETTKKKTRRRGGRRDAAAPRLVAHRVLVVHEREHRLGLDRKLVAELGVFVVGLRRLVAHRRERTLLVLAVELAQRLAAHL